MFNNACSFCNGELFLPSQERKERIKTVYIVLCGSSQQFKPEI